MFDSFLFVSPDFCKPGRQMVPWWEQWLLITTFNLRCYVPEWAVPRSKCRQLWRCQKHLRDCSWLGTHLVFIPSSPKSSPVHFCLEERRGRRFEPFLFCLCLCFFPSLRLLGFSLEESWYSCRNWDKGEKENATSLQSKSGKRQDLTWRPSFPVMSLYDVQHNHRSLETDPLP